MTYCRRLHELKTPYRDGTTHVTLEPVDVALHEAALETKQSVVEVAVPVISVHIAVIGNKSR